jgi:protease-4
MLSRRSGAWALAPVLALAAVAAPPARAADDKTTKTVSLAHIRLHGSLDEAPVPLDPLFGSSTSENFKAKIDRIKKAQRDRAVGGLLLQIDSVSIGWAKLDEMSRAIADFRKAGKKAYAYLEAGSTKDYLLALACDEVALPEPGTLMLTGVRAEVSFFKDLFDQIGVKADMLQMGEAKSAAEPFTRTSLSEASRKQLTLVIDDYYDNNIVGRIVRSRPQKHFTAEQVKKLIDQGPFTAKAAHKAGLIDRVAYIEDFESALKAPLQATHLKIVKNYGQKKSEDIDFSNPFALMRTLFTPPKITTSSKPKIAVIYAVGAITTGKSSQTFLAGETVGSTTMVEAIRQAEKDETVKAIVLRVDSPGGSALASDLIWHELKRSKKPVVASMSDVAASGGYYISMAAKKIYADPGTLTGSIGVVGGKIALGGAFNKIGIKTEVIKRGANSGILSTDEPFTPSEREAMTVLMKDIYDQFLDKALEGRKKAGKQMTRDELLKLAGGRVWTGRQAKANGLIDEVGSLEDAIAAARAMTDLPADKEPELLILPHSKSLLDTLLEGKSDTRLSVPGLEKVLRDFPELRGKLKAVDGLLQLRGEPVWLMAPYQVQID